MKMKAFSVFDSKAEAYLLPFFTTTAGQAVRMFSDACMQEDHAFHKHASDYTLFEIGAFDEESGTFSTLSAHVNLGCAVEYVAKQGNLAIVKEGA